MLITKLSDMGVPSWLYKIFIAFLSDRKMRVRYKGKQNSVKSLPGGGPHGTLLGLLLFIVLSMMWDLRTKSTMLESLLLVKGI